jgi:hypothetical protein
MANTYYTFSPNFTPGQKVRSDEVNTQYAAVEAAFDLLPTDNDAILRGTTFLGVDSGTANALEITLTDIRTSYQDGDQISWKATNTNTGAATINIDSIGAVNLVGADGNVLGAGDVSTGLYYTAIFDSANNRWQMLGASAAALAAADDRVTWASEWATQPVGVPVSVAAGGDGVSDYSALHWASSSAADAGFAATSESNAADSAAAADASAIAAAASAAGVNLPPILGGDAGKMLKVNVGETAFEFIAQGTGGGLDADTVDGIEGAALLARANHTGTQTLATISDSGSLAAKSTINNDDWSGTRLSVANGGTGQGSTIADTVLVGAHGSTNAYIQSNVGTLGHPFVSSGGIAEPEFGGDLYNLETAHFALVSNGNSGTSKTINWNSGNKQAITMTGNCTFSFTAPAGGAANLVLKIVQDGTGGRTATWPAEIKWPNGVTPVLSTGAGDVDIITFFYDSANWFGAAMLDFS